MSIQGDTPEAALRSLLLAFPFLPIDAGQGADRVISCFARAYVRQNPIAIRALGFDTLVPDVVAGEDSEDEDSEDEELELDVGEEFARDFVYTLTYSIIMLNTDLHNPAISPKITADEYTSSCRRCVPLRTIDENVLRSIYHSIRDQPLQIFEGGQLGELTIVRASADSDDTETGARYSLYSRLRQPTADGAIPGGATPGGIAGVNSSAAGSFHTHTGAGTAAQQHRLPGRAPVQIDWAVAYWNVIDAGRYARAASWRYVAAHINHSVVFLRAATPASIALSVAVACAAMVLMVKARS